MDAGTAIATLKSNTHIRRTSWAEGVFIHYEDIESGRIIYQHDPAGCLCEWHATDEDLAANDWEVLTEIKQPA